MKKQLLCLMAALLQCSCILGSCGGESAETSAMEETIPQETGAVIPEETTNGREDYKDSLTETMDFSGASIRLLTRSGDADVKMEFYSEELTGDVVNDAVFQRNLDVETRLNVTMELILCDSVTKHLGTASLIKESVTAGSDDYELISNALYDSVPLTMKNYFLDLNSLEYLDFTQPWWNKSLLEMTQWNGKNYLAMGELSQTMISGAFCMFFNKNLFEEYFPDGPSLYEVVLEEKWTLDTMTEYCTVVYSDTNGNGTPDEGDTFGHYYIDGPSLGADAFFGACQLDLVERLDENTYQFNGTGEKMVSFFEKMNYLLFRDNNTLRLPQGTNVAAEVSILSSLMEHKTVFTAWMLSGVQILRDMEDDYGILPMPKLDETQTSYGGYTHDGSSAFSIPVTETDTAATAAFLEAISAETYRKVTPAYFETALKTKYSRDSESSQMMDMIVEFIRLDWAHVYGASIGNPMWTIRDNLGSSSLIETTVSTFASKESAVLNSIQKICDAYATLEE